MRISTLFASINPSTSHKSFFPFSKPSEVNIEVPDLSPNNSDNNIEQSSNSIVTQIPEIPMPVSSPQPAPRNSSNTPFTVRKSMRTRTTRSYLSDYITNAVQLANFSTSCFFSYNTQFIFICCIINF